MIESTDTDKYLELYAKLNPEQQKAVDTTEGPVIVVAGPGTGKTQILSMRIANILRNPDLQMEPHNILCLTFTESGVTAMRNRLASIIGSTAYYVRIHTFHSFCNELIAAHPDKFSAMNPICDDLEQIKILNKIIDALPANSVLKPFGAPYFYRNEIINKIKAFKREAISPDKFIDITNQLTSFSSRNFDILDGFFAQNFRSVKMEDCQDLIDQLYDESPESEQFIPRLFDSYLQHSSKPAEFKKYTKDIIDKHLSPKAIEKFIDLHTLYTSYINELEEARLFDFEDMILKVIDKLHSDEELRQIYQEQFQYILVDEYQDTNGAQNQIIELLAHNPHQEPNLFVVGDDDQSIYRFQGAAIENIIGFYKRFQDSATVVVLDKNYRSQQNILDAAGFCVKNNEKRIINTVDINKDLEAKAPTPLAPVEINQYSKQDDELYAVSKCIQQLITDGVNPSEIAVLYRANRDVQALSDFLTKLEISYTLDAGENVLDDIEVCQLIDLLKVIQKPQANSDLLFKLLSYDFIFNSELLCDVSYQDIFMVTRERRRSQDPENPSSFIDHLLKTREFKAFAEKLLEFQFRAENLRLDIFFEQVIKEFNYLGHALKAPDKVVKLKKLNCLFDDIKEQQHLHNPIRTSANKQFNLDDFITRINMMQENYVRILAKSNQVSGSAVKLMTAHGSKGLEFEHVFMINCVDKHWGNKTARELIKFPIGLVDSTEAFTSKLDANEDDRRLFFVGMTRAKQKLYISYYSKDAKGKDKSCSMFVSETLGLRSVSPDKVDFNTYEADESTELLQLETKFLDKQENFAALEASWIDSLLENYKLSVTHLNNFLKCPLKFFYQNLIRVPAAKNKFSAYGTAVHAALYDLFVAFNSIKKQFTKEERRAKIDEYKVSKRQYMLEQFKMHLEREGLIADEFEQCIANGEKELGTYFDRYIEEWLADDTSYILEMDFGAKGVNLDGITLAGKLDKIELNEAEKSVKVIDYKTGNPSNKASDLKAGGDYHRQIVFYQMLTDLARKNQSFNYKMESGEIDFVRHDAKKIFRKTNISVTAEDLEQLSKDIHHMNKEIRAHRFPGCGEPDCDVCGSELPIISHED